MDRILCALIYLITALSGFSGKKEKWEPGRKLKVLLVGYNGARNTGSDVRVAAIARQVKALFGADNVQLAVMTLNAKALEGYFDEDVELLEFSSFFPLDLLRACTRHHAAILCEGSTLKSTFANALTLFMCEAAGIMARQGKRRFVFISTAYVAGQKSGLVLEDTLDTEAFSSLYEKSKAGAEALVRASGLPWSICRAEGRHVQLFPTCLDGRGADQPSLLGRPQPATALSLLPAAQPCGGGNPGLLCALLSFV